MPFSPVQALALPELTTTAEILVLVTCRLQTVTAAETILLVVKTAAALAPVGQTSNPRSFLPDFLMPQGTPAAKKPLGDVIVLFFIVLSMGKKLPESQNPFKIIRLFKATNVIRLVSDFELRTSNFRPKAGDWVCLALFSGHPGPL